MLDMASLFRRLLGAISPLAGQNVKHRSRNASRMTKIIASIDILESRVVPVVGRNVIPAPIVPGSTMYDGVAFLRAGGDTGTGALINSGSLPGELDGRYILTVAHNNETGAAGSVTFNLARNVTIPLPANAGANRFTVNHPTFNSANHLDDIALWRLVDPINPAPNRPLVAPFGAQQYQLNLATDEIADPPTTEFTGREKVSGPF